MDPISFKRHRFPPEVIRYAVRLYLPFTLSLRDVEKLLAQRGMEVSYETIRCWTVKFGPLFARNLRRRRPSLPAAGAWTRWSSRSEDGACISGVPWTTKAMLVQNCRNKSAAFKLLRKLLRNQGIRPEAIVTDNPACTEPWSESSASPCEAPSAYQGP